MKTIEGKFNRITVRLPDSIIHVLKKESDEKVLPLNAVVSRIITNYVNIESKKASSPTITLSKFLFSKIIENLNKSDMDKVAKQGPTILRKLLTMLDIQYTLPNIIENHFSFVGKYYGWYKFRYTSKENHYRLIFEPELGEKGILFLSLYIKSILQSLNINVDKESIDESSIIIEFTLYDAT